MFTHNTRTAHSVKIKTLAVLRTSFPAYRFDRYVATSDLMVVGRLKTVYSAVFAVGETAERAKQNDA